MNAALPSGVHDGQLVISGRAPDQLVFAFWRAGDDEPHRVLTSAPVVFEAIDDEDSVPRGPTGSTLIAPRRLAGFDSPPT